MSSLREPKAERTPVAGVAPIPIVALDVADESAALRILDTLPEADFFKVGLQLYVAEGPRILKLLQDRGKQIFLDLKFHDIPNTVAGAVRSAAAHGVDLLTLHASGGAEMLRAAAAEARRAERPPLLLGVTVLTSLDEAGVASAWGRDAVELESEAVRLARLASVSGLGGVVAAVHEAPAIRRASPDLRILTPGIRLAGDSAGDQSRVATPADALRAGSDYIILGRTVTASPDPRAAYRQAVAQIGTRS